MPCAWQIHNYEALVSQGVIFTDSYSDQPLEVAKDNWTKKGHIMIDTIFNAKTTRSQALVLELTVMPWRGLLENSKTIKIPLTLS